MLYLLLSCKVRSVIRFLLTKNYNSIEIHRQFHKMHRDEIIGDDDGMRQSFVLFKNGRADVHDVVVNRPL